MALSFRAQCAGPVALVNSVSGNAFVMLDGKILELRKGTYIQDMSEVFTEIGAQITLSDFNDHVFHLSGSGHLHFLNELVELKSGYLWFQSFRKKGKSQIHTANAKVEFINGEGILSFDELSGKTQLLVVKDTMAFGNLSEPELDIAVMDGNFSYIDSNYEGGRARESTPIGYASYKKINSLFQGMKGLTKSELPGINRVEENMVSIPNSKNEGHLRSLASLDKESKNKRSGELIFIHKSKKNKMPALDTDKIYEASLNKMKRSIASKRTIYDKPSGTIIRVYGTNTVKIPVSKAIIKRNRAPASVKIKPKKVTVENDAFQKSMMKHYKQQMRHSNEVQGLIRELENYDQDYKINY